MDMWSGKALSWYGGVIESLWLCDPWSEKGLVLKRLGLVGGLKLEQAHLKFSYTLMPGKHRTHQTYSPNKQGMRGVAVWSIWACLKTNSLIILVDWSWCRGTVEVSGEKGIANRRRNQNSLKMGRERNRTSFQAGTPLSWIPRVIGQGIKAEIGPGLKVYLHGAQNT